MTVMEAVLNAGYSFPAAKRLFAAGNVGYRPADGIWKQVAQPTDIVYPGDTLGIGNKVTTVTRPPQIKESSDNDL